MAEPLCPEAEERAAMTDAEFWERVACNLLGYDPGPDDDEIVPDYIEMAELHLTTRCPECGAVGACGYDEMGRPMIHTTPKDDADDD